MGRRWRQWYALRWTDAVWRVLSRGLRRRSTQGPVPGGRFLRLWAELAFPRLFPRAHSALIFVRSISGGLLSPLLASGGAGRALQHALSEQPQQATAWLARLEALVRYTRPIHLVDWRLRLSGAELRSLTLDGTHSEFLRGVDLSRGRLLEVRFIGVVSDADFAATKVDDCTFIGCRLSGTSFRGAVFEDVVFAIGDAWRCCFDGAQIRRCTFSDIDLDFSTFAGAVVHDVVFERCDFAGVNLANVGGEWRDVDFLDCLNLDPAFEPAAETGVWVGESTAEAPFQRGALGAYPRALAREAPPVGRESIAGRYAQAEIQSPPPLGYRLQTVARFVSLWIGLGPDYHEVRREALKVDDGLALSFPKRRWVAVLRMLLGVREDIGSVSVARYAYRLLSEGLRDRDPSLAEVELPELVVVNGSLPTARYVESAGGSYIVISRGLEVTATRVARYCIAWLAPDSIEYMDAWPASRDQATVRAAVEASLEDFARSGGDIAVTGRVQVGGLRDSQALALMMSLLTFAVAHELAHFLRNRGLLGPSDPRLDPEGQADVDAVRMLAEVAGGNGDEDLIEALRNMPPDFLRSYYKRRLSKLDEIPLSVRGLSDAEVAELHDSVMPYVSRFADCDWVPAVIAAFIMAFGGSVGYRDNPNLFERSTRVVRASLGEEAVSDLVEEFSRPDSVLGMLRSVFEPGSASV